MSKNNYSFAEDFSSILLTNIEIDVVPIGCKLDSVTLTPQESTEGDFLCRELVDEIFSKSYNVSYYVSESTLVFEGRFGVIHVSLGHLSKDVLDMLSKIHSGNSFVMRRELGFSLLMGE